MSDKIKYEIVADTSQVEKAMNKTMSDINKLTGDVAKATDNLQKDINKVNLDKVQNQIKELSKDWMKPLELKTSSDIELGDVNFDSVLRRATNTLDTLTGDVETFNALLDYADDYQLDRMFRIANEELNQSLYRLDEFNQKLLAANVDGDWSAVEGIGQEIQNELHWIEMLKERLNSINEVSYEETTSKISMIGEHTKKLTNKMAKLGKRILWAFTVASFGTIRAGMAEAINLSETARGKMDAIRVSIGSGLVPIIDAFVAKLQYAFVWLAKLIYIFTGFNILEKAIGNTVKKMNKLRSGIKGTAKEANRMLGGFDEITNIGDSGGGGLAGGLGADFDKLGNSLSELEKMREMFENIDISWAENLWNWLKKNWKVLLAIGALIATVWAVSKLLFFIVKISEGIEVVKKFSGIIRDLNGAWGLVGAGIALIIAPIAILYTQWDNLSTAGKIICAILPSVGGAMVAVGAKALIMGTSIATAISVATLGIGAVIGAIIGVVSALVSWIKKSATAHKEIKNKEEATKALAEAQKEYTKSLESSASAEKALRDSKKNLTKAQNEYSISGKKLYDEISKNPEKLSKLTDAELEVYSAYVEVEQKQQEMKDTLEELTEKRQESNKALFEEKLATIENSEQMGVYRDSVVNAMGDASISSEQGKELLEKAMADMDYASQKTFMENLPEDVREGLEPNRYATAGTKFKNGWSSMMSNIGETTENTMNSIVGWISDKLTDASIAWEDFKKSVVDIIDNIKQGWKNFIDGIKEKWDAFVNWIKEGWNNTVQKIKDKIEEWKEKWREFVDGIKEKWDNSIEKIKSKVDEFKRKWNEIIDKVKKKWDEFREKLDRFKETIEGIKESISNVFKNAINKILKWGGDKINSFIRAINSAIGWINKVLPKNMQIGLISEISIPQLAVGTNFVPRDMIAQLHKGEAVVPARFNEDKFFSNEGNRDLLEEIRDAIRYKELVIDRDSIGEASVGYIHDKQRLTGEFLL